MATLNQLQTKYYDQLIGLLNDSNTNEQNTQFIEYLNLFNNKTDKDVENLINYSSNLSIIKNLEWLNVDKSLNYDDDLKGRIVLLDFWTYCCINCLHAIPMLKTLEEKYQNLLVIGVHSAKFPNEKSKKNILHAAHRHLLKHPIVCDNNLDIWTCLEVNCWPTFMILNPSGYIIGQFQGEIQANLIDKFLEICFKYYKNDLKNMNSIDLKALSLNNISKAETNNLSELSFPSKLCLNTQNSILFISDSGNNRVLAVDKLTSKLLYSIGTSGQCGYQNGTYDEAKFNWPQGIAFDSDTQYLYIADTGNNIIRSVDLTKRVVSTLCGQYNDGSVKIGDYDYTGGKPALEQSISSPWDVCLVSKVIESKTYKFLAIACAGTHQIWLYAFSSSDESDITVTWWKNVNITLGMLKCIAGNGKERNRNNSYPMQASFAQPSGVCVDKSNETMYIADAESSTVRSISLKDGAVKNVVGGDPSQPDNLFAYGDVDGKGSETRLQHPLDVKLVFNDTAILIADSYNHKLKLVDLKTKFCKNFEVKFENNNQFSEPNGLCIDETKEIIYIADTNNDSIRIITKFSTQNTVDTFNIDFSTVFKHVESNDLNSTMVDKDDLFVKLENDSIHLNSLAMNSWSLLITQNENEEPIILNGKIDALNTTNQHKLVSINIDRLSQLIICLTLYYCIKNNDSNEICKLFKYEKQFTKEHLLNNRLFYENHNSKRSRITIDIKIV